MITQSDHSLSRKQRKQQKSNYKQEITHNQNTQPFRQIPHERPSPVPLLCVDLDQEGINLYMNANVKKKGRVYYNREGQKQKNVICDKFLSERIQSVIIEETFTPKKQFFEANITLDDKFVKRSAVQQEIQKQQVKLLRYFHNQRDTDDEEDNEIALIKCYHCKQLGHTARTCLQSIKVKCSYCLSDHHSSMCSNILCSQCHKPEHIGKQCEVRLKCFRCRKVGHLMKECGQVMLNTRDQQECSDKFDKADMERVYCLKCGDMGHTNCHRYMKQIPVIYTEASS